MAYRAGVACLLALVACGFLGNSSRAQEAESVGTVHALIVTGLPGTPVHARRFADWSERFRRHLTVDMQVPAEQVLVLAGEGNGVAAEPATAVPSTREGLREALAGIAAAARPRDAFVLVLMAHGSLVEGSPRLVLPGVDLAAAELRGLLAPIRAANQVVLLFFAGSGDVLRDVAAPGRVTIAATSPMEVSEPVFAEFFLQALEEGRADGQAAPEGGRHDGSVTVLEAFNWAALEAPRWIRRMRKSPDDDSWVVTGREAVRLFEKLYGGPPDQPGTRQLSPRSAAHVPDPPVPLVTPREQAEEFQNTRVVTEHALLEDNGQPVGTSACTAGVYRPITGSREGEPGSLARTLVLGRAQRLRVPEP